VRWEFSFFTDRIVVEEKTSWMSEFSEVWTWQHSSVPNSPAWHIIYSAAKVALDTCPTFYSILPIILVNTFLPVIVTTLATSFHMPLRDFLNTNNLCILIYSYIKHLSMLWSYRAKCIMLKIFIPLLQKYNAVNY
jgi:hypothetical protein